MNIVRTLLASFCLLLSGVTLAAEAVITNLNELAARGTTDERQPFRLQGTILYSDRSPALYCDGQIINLTALRLGMFSGLRSGDRIAAEGYRRKQMFNVRASKTRSKFRNYINFVYFQFNRCAISKTGFVILGNFIFRCAIQGPAGAQC